MRLFIGIKLSEQVREKLCEICRDLKERASQMKWVKEDNVHITLKFLGETEKRDQIIGILDNKISASRFTLKFTGLGKFGRGDELRVLWAGIEQSDRFNALFNEIESGLEPIGFPKEQRKFSPHITLGRNRYGKVHQDLINEIDRLADHSFGEQEIFSFQLMSSTLTLSGPIYKTLFSFPTGK
ncbi:MAG: RNA 2',3'-cyclic phosphodiesterase [Candidatus Aminicenantes bacterium]|nr:RNA 2',3'-cyclic phosphodiesterase [Candidatus Aminicenantes bacterium]